MLKLNREHAGMTQRQCADRCGVDVTTVQSWESGRRPVSLMSAGALAAVMRTLVAAGADPAAVGLISAAMAADAILTHALSHGDGRATSHPLAHWVVTRDVVHMVVWALTGQRPSALPDVPVRRSGPVPAAPLLAADARRRVYAHLRRTAESARGDGAALLSRQCVYLSSYDTADDTRAWIAGMSVYPSRETPGAWSPAWVAARSVATSATRHGHSELLERFMAEGLASDSGTAANLAYWAHWLGVDRLPRADDSFMAAAPAWDPGTLMRALTDRMSPGLGCLTLNIRSAWSLTLAHPWLLSDPVIGADVESRAALLLDSGDLPATARRELEQMHYGVRLQRR